MTAARSVREVRAAQRGEREPFVDYADGFLDITGAARVEVQISADGTVLWVHAPQTCLRICGIHGPLMIDDHRQGAQK